MLKAARVNKVLGVLCTLGLLAVLGGGLTPPAHADGASQMYWLCAPVDANHPNGGYCPVSAGYPMPVTNSPAGVQLVSPNFWTVVAGTQRGLSIAAATTPTIPATATILVVEAQGTNGTGGACLYWQDDGANPTNAAGQALVAFQSLVYKVSSTPIKLIAASGATCTATISYYKDTP